MWNKELEVAKACAIEAGKEIMKIYGDETLFHVEYKEDSSPLTAADKLSNKTIMMSLRENFPAYSVLSEEEMDSKERLANDLCFVIDPLDGTKEFIKRNGQFTVNIALSYKHKVVMGVIYVPVTRELYYATQGSGAYLEVDGRATRLSVSDRTKDLRCVVSRSHNCAEMIALIEKYQINNLVEMGSSLKGCLIVRGDADIYYRYNPTMEWDTAAMQCIVEEAGGIFRQMDGKEMLYNRENSLNDKGFYAVNQEVNIFQ